MAPDFGLIPDAAQGQADIFPVQGFCNRLAKRGLAGSGRTYQEENAALVVSPELHDGQMLQDPLLHLLQAVVVVVQNLLGVLEVGLFPFLQVPGEGEDEVQIVPYHGSLGRALGLVIQTVELVQSRVFNFFGEPGLGDPLPVVLLLPPLAAGLAVFRVPVILVQFLLDGGHLLLQHLLPIVFVRPLGHALIDTDIPVQGLPLLDQDIHEVQGPVPVGIGFQEFILLIGAHGGETGQPGDHLGDRVDIVHELEVVVRPLEVGGDILHDVFEVGEHLRLLPGVEVIDRRVEGVRSRDIVLRIGNIRDFDPGADQNLNQEAVIRLLDRLICKRDADAVEVFRASGVGSVLQGQGEMGLERVFLHLFKQAPCCAGQVDIGRRARQNQGVFDRKDHRFLGYDFFFFFITNIFIHSWESPFVLQGFFHLCNSSET